MCGGKFSLYALGMILSVRRRFAVAAGEKSYLTANLCCLLNSSLALPIAFRCDKYLYRQVCGSCRVVVVVVVVVAVVVVVVVCTWSELKVVKLK